MDTLIIYDYNVNGDVYYGECHESDWANVKADLTSRGFAVNMLDEVYGPYFKCPKSRDVMLVASLL